MAQFGRIIELDVEFPELDPKTADGKQGNPSTQPCSIFNPVADDDDDNVAEFMEIETVYLYTRERETRERKRERSHTQKNKYTPGGGVQNDMGYR